jgi:hypothetical protein
LGYFSGDVWYIPRANNAEGITHRPVMRLNLYTCRPTPAPSSLEQPGRHRRHRRGGVSLIPRHTLVQTLHIQPDLALDTIPQCVLSILGSWIYQAGSEYLVETARVWPRLALTLFPSRTVSMFKQGSRHLLCGWYLSRLLQQFFAPGVSTRKDQVYQSPHTATLQYKNVSQTADSLP